MEAMTTKPAVKELKWQLIDAYYRFSRTHDRKQFETMLRLHTELLRRDPLGVPISMREHLKELKWEMARRRGGSPEIVRQS
ncbi:hypothetical protein ABID56_002580 [Alkalibacillus flavidus]|uniref:Uncharacterized protein n=1 Tax=Alkalibacillus flavidus TaxID=546021 RepID=A0ABV2KXX4_9BACI